MGKIIRDSETGWRNYKLQVIVLYYSSYCGLGKGWVTSISFSDKLSSHAICFTRVPIISKQLRKLKKDAVRVRKENKIL